MSKIPRSVKASTKGPAQTATPAPPVAGAPLWFLENPLLHLLLLALVGLIAYSNTFHVPFVFDDNSSIVDNPVVKDLPAFLSGRGYAYNPRRFIGYLTFALNYRLGGLDVTGYHLVNLAIHIFTAWLVYFFVRLTLRTPYFAKWSAECGMRSAECGIQKPFYSEFRIPNSLLPLLAALLFVAHPVQTQAVTYIVQRLASLATLFYLASLVFYIKARLMSQVSSSEFRVPSSNQKPETRNQKPAAFFYILSLISAILAMRTKEITFTLPLVAVLYEFSFFGISRKKLLSYFLVILLLLAIFLVMLPAGKPIGELLSDVNEQTRVQTGIPRFHYLLTQFSVITTYIGLLFLPVGQNLDYDYPVYDTLFNPRVFFSFIFLAGLFSLAVYLYYRSSQCKMQNAKYKMQNANNPSNFALCTLHFSFFIPKAGALRLIAFGILWFFITLSVESSIIPIVDVIFEHRLYLPSVGAFLAVSATTALLAKRVGMRALTVSAAVVALVLASAAWHRNQTWRDSLILWQDVVDKSPRKGRPRNELGKVLFLRNQTDEAIEQYRLSLSLDPACVFVHVNLGAAYYRKGLIDQAIQEYNAALSAKTDYPELHLNLGAAYNEKGLLDKATEEYQLVLQQQPDNAEAHINIGIIHHKKGKLDLAIKEFQAALRFNPDSSAAHNAMGRAYVQAQLLDKAVEHFNTAIALDPNDADSKYRVDKLLAVIDMMKRDRTAPP